MYLTHMALNPDRRSTRELMQSPQRMHAAVLSAFVPGTSEHGRILWRVDNVDRHNLHLYVVSPVAPSLEAVADQAGWPSQPVWRTADYAPFLLGLGAGQRWLFRVRANPIRNARPPEGGRGERVPLRGVQEHLTWLTERSTGWGFSVAEGEHGPNIRVTEKRTERFRRGGPGGRLVTLATAAFEGVLEVTDPVRLANALAQGVGAGKAYGCGLMTLARG
jgi:CRISPR system Cascade subunit CasE